MKYHPALVFLVVAFLVFLSVRIIWSQFIEPIYRPIDEMEEELGVSLVFNFAMRETSSRRSPPSARGWPQLGQPTAAADHNSLEIEVVLAGDRVDVEAGARHAEAVHPRRSPDTVLYEEREGHLADQ